MSINKQTLSSPPSNPPPSRSINPAPPSPKFPWDALPQELKSNILRRIPLSQLLLTTQDVFIHDAPTELDDRIRALQPLWRAWIDSPIAVRNVVAYRTRHDRLACTPAQFSQLTRLVLGSSGLSGCLTTAIHEFAHTLKVLHLDDNALTDLPPEIALCDRLLLLDCSQNAFRAVPPSVFQIRALRYLVFAQNSDVDLIPRPIAALPNLIALSFYRCALTNLPAELVQKAAETRGFSLNVSSNRFPRRYLAGICDMFPTFKRRLTHVMLR